MGGARGGEIASRVAATALGESVDGSGEERVVALIQEANRQVYDRAREDSDASGMGTTITVALVEDGIVSIGHVGDSRAYLIRDRKVDQLTEDHSLVAELVRTRPPLAGGGRDPSAALRHHARARHRPRRRRRLVLGRGQAGRPVPHLLRRADVDGRRRGDPRRRRAAAATTSTPSAKELVAAANRSGGEDNITVVFFEVAEEGAQAPSETKPMPALDGEPAAGARGRRGHAVRADRRAGRRHDGRPARAGPEMVAGAPGRAARAEAAPRRPGGAHGDRARRRRRRSSCS